MIIMIVKFSISFIDKDGLSFSDILMMIIINKDMNVDFEKYCEMILQDPSDKICRSNYLIDLKRAEKFGISNNVSD